MDEEEKNKDKGETRQLFVFELSGEDYAVDVMKVGEVIKSEEKTINPIPNSKEFIKGITNVRGQVIPIIDLETKFGLQPEDDRFIVLFEIEGSTCGILVDQVDEVLRVNEKRIKNAPDAIRQKIHHKYVDDVALLEDDRMIIILDLNAGFRDEDHLEVSELAEEEEEDEEEVEEVSEDEIKEKAKEKLS